MADPKEIVMPVETTKAVKEIRQKGREVAIY
jgi:hypothetical protein